MLSQLPGGSQWRQTAHKSAKPHQQFNLVCMSWAGVRKNCTATSHCMWLLHCMTTVKRSEKQFFDFAVKFFRSYLQNKPCTESIFLFSHQPVGSHWACSVQCICTGFLGIQRASNLGKKSGSSLVWRKQCNSWIDIFYGHCCSIMRSCQWKF